MIDRTVHDISQKLVNDTRRKAEFYECLEPIQGFNLNQSKAASEEYFI